MFKIIFGWIVFLFGIFLALLGVLVMLGGVIRGDIHFFLILQLLIFGVLLTRLGWRMRKAQDV